MPVLNALQKAILATAIVLFIGMGLYPPWQKTHQYGEGRIRTLPMGYHSLFAAAGIDSSIDTRQLTVQWIALVVGTLGLLWLAQGVNTKDLLDGVARIGNSGKKRKKPFV